MEILIVLLISGAAVAAVLIPLLRAGSPSDPQLGTGEDAAPMRDPAHIERLVKQYRAALRAGTVCRRCGRANPQGSAFCAECGRRLRDARAIPDAGENAS